MNYLYTKALKLIEVQSSLSNDNPTLYILKLKDENAIRKKRLLYQVHWFLDADGLFLCNLLEIMHYLAPAT